MMSPESNHSTDTRNSHNLLITCGTSQIDKAKDGPLDCDENTKRDIQNALDYPLSGSPENYLESVSDTVEDLADKLIGYLPQRHIYVPRPDDPSSDKSWWEKNLFGGELSTLIRMEQKMFPDEIASNCPTWPCPAADRLVVLVSHTQAGLLSGAILKKVLEKGYGFSILQFDEQGNPLPKPGVETVLIMALTEYTNYPNKAEENLAKRITGNLLRGDTWRNILLVTGGFKSLIPCLTMITLLYGIEMVYLFERSSALQHLRFVSQDNADKNRKWRDIWLDFEGRGWLSPSPCLSEVMARWRGKRANPVPPEEMYG